MGTVVCFDENISVLSSLYSIASGLNCGMLVPSWRDCSGSSLTGCAMFGLSEAFETVEIEIVLCKGVFFMEIWLMWNYLVGIAIARIVQKGFCEIAVVVCCLCHCDVQ